MRYLLLVWVAIATINSCKKEVQPDPIAKEEYTEAINISFMDTLIRPQDDFYNYVNGNWMKNTVIPADRGRWGSFDELRERTDSASLLLLKKIIENEEFSEDELLTANLYKSIVDTINRNKDGLKPIGPQLIAIDDIQNLTDLNDYLTKEAISYSNPLYGIYVRPHMKDSEVNAVYFDGPKLGMSRKYYQSNDKDATQKLLAYQGYLKNILGYIGDPSPENSAMEVLDFETKLASNILSFEDLRNSDLQYNPISTKELDAVVTKTPLTKYLKELNIAVDSLIIPEIKYYNNLDNLINQKNIPIIKKYLKANLVNEASTLLNSDLEKINFDFYSKELNGIESMRPLEKRALSKINNTIGQAFGKSYVKAYFPKEAKAKSEEMVRYIRKAFENHLRKVSWMTDSTKTKALNKLEKFNVKIGYPDNWKEYDGLELKDTTEGGSYYDNIKRISKFEFQKDVEKIGEKVDKSEWFMPPQMVNAYYSSQFNEIVFPAAILQPPFYNYKADAAVNFGGMGAVIGHEISHGFDDSGSQYDGDGNLLNWWNMDDKKEFSVLGEKLANQYNAYEPLEGIFVNGNSTLGENIADLGGVNVAFDALQMYLRDNGSPKEIDGLTPNQRFFISWATVWRTKSNDEALKNQIKSDFHAPGYYRAIGPLENIDSFYETFNVNEGDKMYKPKEERIKIW